MLNVWPPGHSIAQLPGSATQRSPVESLAVTGRWACREMTEWINNLMRLNTRTEYRILQKLRSVNKSVEEGCQRSLQFIELAAYAIQKSSLFLHKIRADLSLECARHGHQIEPCDATGTGAGPADPATVRPIIWQTLWSIKLILRKISLTELKITSVLSNGTNIDDLQWHWLSL